MRCKVYSFQGSAMKNDRKPFQPETVSPFGPGVEAWQGPDDNNHSTIVEKDMLERRAVRTAFAESQRRVIEERLKRR
jgi:hypothetical protein